MLTIRPAKNLQGRLDLPPSPDLFVLASVVALARQQPIRIIPPIDLPVLRDWEAALDGHATFSRTESECIVTPITDNPPARITFPSVDLPYRDLTLFTLLGMGKIVAFESIAEKRSRFWQEQMQRLGYTLRVEAGPASTCLRITDATSGALSAPVIGEADVRPLLGLLLGASAVATFTVDYTPLSPLRNIAPAFGYRISVKSTLTRERNESARRLQIMRQKNRPSAAGQQFIVTADFSRRSGDFATEPVVVTLPGDELAGALFTAAQCLFPKSSLVIGNHPLETWATPVAAFIRKMGCKVSLQETGSTAFGSTGILHVQSTGLTGRKMECLPAALYISFFPAMAMLASFADGETVFRGLADLRLDEQDGIELVESCIGRLDVRHGEMPDGIVIKGDRDHDGFDLIEPLPAACAAAFAIAGLRCMGTTTVNDEPLHKRLPQFEAMLRTVCEYRD